MFKHKHLALTIALLAVVLPLALTKLAGAQAVVQSYGSDTTLQPGMIVQLDPKDSSKVKPASQAQADSIHGVVVPPNDAPVSLQTNNTSQQYYIATDGDYQVLVSDENGAIHKGDYIAISAISGVGMKASSGQTVVLGKALNDFDGKQNVQGTSTLTLSNGQKITVRLGQVGIDISLSHNPLYQPSTKNAVENALQRIAEGVVHKPVSLIHLYMSFAVFIIAVIISTVLLFSGVQSSVIAMGRNPLARSHIFRSMLGVIFTSLVVLLIGVFAVYLLLKL